VVKTVGYHERIEGQLKLLSKEQLCLFAWLCGLRCLPVLSAGRAFTYWKPEEKQKHLYSIFYALDACAGGWALQSSGDPALDSAIAGATGDAGAAAASAAKEAAAAAVKNIPAKSSKNAAWIAWTASDVASAAAWAAKSASATAKSGAALNAAAWAFRASTTGGKGNDPGRFANDAAFWGPGAFTRIGTIDIFGKTIPNDIAVIFNTIAAIENNDLSLLKKGASIYGEIWNNTLEDPGKTGIYGAIWNNFLEDLASAGCAYWARLYKNFFKNNTDIKDSLIMDEEELKRRLFGVPDEIRAQGAAAVGEYLDNQE
jgi:hypothetical protein